MGVGLGHTHGTGFCDLQGNRKPLLRQKLKEQEGAVGSELPSTWAQLSSSALPNAMPCAWEEAMLAAWGQEGDAQDV